MEMHGRSGGEARQSPRRYPDPDTLWHDWKQEEYRSSATSDGNNREAPDLTEADRGTRLLCSSLCRLPRELLDLTLSFLPRDSELSLRLSCPTLYHNCGTQSMFSLVYTLRIDVDPGVRQRCFWIVNSWCQRHHQRKPLGTLPCFPCRTRHPRSFFSKEEAAKMTERRSCLGWTRRLYVTPQCWVTFQHVSKARQMGDLWGFEIQRPSSYHQRIGHYSDIGDELTALNDAVPEGRSSRAVQAVLESGPSIPVIDTAWPTPVRLSPLCAEFYSFTLSYDLRLPVPPIALNALPLQSFRKSFGRHPIRFCPHLSSDDLEMRQLVQALLNKQRSRLNCKMCKTWLTLDVHGSDMTVLRVHVKKDIGDTHSALDSTWLAHLM